MEDKQKKQLFKPPVARTEDEDVVGYQVDESAFININCVC